MTESLEILKGTLDLLVLRILSEGPSHGYAVIRRLEELTDQALSIEEGSMYPALYRMQKRGWIFSEWRRTEEGRRAKVYELTDEGRRRLAEEATYWTRFSRAVENVLEGAAGPFPRRAV